MSTQYIYFVKVHTAEEGGRHLPQHRQDQQRRHETGKAALTIIIFIYLVNVISKFIVIFQIIADY